MFWQHFGKDVLNHTYNLTTFRNGDLLWAHIWTYSITFCTFFFKSKNVLQVNVSGVWDIRHYSRLIVRKYILAVTRSGWFLKGYDKIKVLPHISHKFCPYLVVDHISHVRQRRSNILKKRKYLFVFFLLLYVFGYKLEKNLHHRTNTHFFLCFFYPKKTIQNLDMMHYFFFGY